MIVKELLKLLVCEVNTQLLDTVALKHLETENIQKTHKSIVITGRFQHRVTHRVNEPIENTTVNVLDQSITICNSKF